MASVTQKGPSGISHSVDQDQHPAMLKTPIRNQTFHTAKNIRVIDVTSVKKVQTLTRRGVGDTAPGLGLHFLHDAGHMQWDRATNYCNTF